MGLLADLYCRICLLSGTPNSKDMATSLPLTSHPALSSSQDFQFACQTGFSKVICKLKKKEEGMQLARARMPVQFWGTLRDQQ